VSDWSKHYTATAQLVQRCRGIWRSAWAALLKSTCEQQKQANRRWRIGPSFRPGQRVWLSTRNLPLRLESRKLGPRYIGPFKILKKKNPGLLPTPITQVHAHIPHTLHHPVPQMVEGQLVYSVQRLLNMRKVRGGVQYLVD
jgi:hypothetical protein